MDMGLWVLGCRMQLVLVLRWTNVIERRVAPLSVVPRLDVGEDGPPRLLARPPVALGDGCAIANQQRLVERIRRIARQVDEKCSQGNQM